jgi:transposase
LVDVPDVIVDHPPHACGGCGVGLDTAMLVGVVRRQVTDVPAVSVTVTEHRLQRRRCGCGCVTGAAAPAGVAAAPASYGPNVRAWVVYALVFQHIPVARVAELIRDLCGAAPSTGWICGVLRQTATALAEVEKLIRTLLTAAHILHVDETGAKVTGARWWLDVAATEKLTSYHLDRARGRAAIEAFGVLDGFTGIAVHDAWASYDGYVGCEHALCGAHIARELVAAGETHPGQRWPTQALDALFGLNTAAHDTHDQHGSVIPPQSRRATALCLASGDPGRTGGKSPQTGPQTSQDPKPPGTPTRPPEPSDPRPTQKPGHGSAATSPPHANTASTPSTQSTPPSQEPLDANVPVNHVNSYAYFSAAHQDGVDHQEPGVIIDTGGDLAVPSVGQGDAANEVELPYVHRLRRRNSCAP